ncbi:MAG: uroporphyrinogen decarboxylase family protein [Candidatus Hermodarchaeota archaeon]
MDSFDRIYAALKGYNVDRTPVFPQIGDHAGIIQNLTYNIMYQDARKAADAHLKALELYGYDIATIQVEPSWPVAEACGTKVVYPIDKNPWITKHLINSEMDFDFLEIPDFASIESTMVMIEGTKLLSNEAKVPIAAFMTGPLTFSLQLMPYEKLIIKLVKDPAFSHKLIKYSVMIIKEYIKCLKDAGATVFVLCEHDFQILKPEQIKEYSLKFLPELFEIFEYNILHMCGKVSTHLNELTINLKQIRDLDMISIGPFVDITRTLELLGPKIGVAGNIDHIKLLPYGTPDKIEVAVKNAIKASLGNPRYIVAPGCEITADVPIENVKALVNATKNF